MPTGMPLFVRDIIASRPPRILARTTPCGGSLTGNQHARANVKRDGHQPLRLQFVEELDADAMARAKFVNAVGVGVLYLIERFAAGNFRARHAFSSVSMSVRGGPM